MSTVRRLLVGLMIGTAMTLVPAVAGAHEPVFVTDADSTPATGPLLEDGNHSWAVYGVITAPGATRGVRTQLTTGQELVVDLLIPDRSPERELSPGSLPKVTIRWPDGTTRTLGSTLRVPFDEPFSGTSYVRIAELREPASQTGVYGLTVTGAVPARFTVATGTVEGFGGAKRDVEPTPSGGLASWYATTPPTVAATTPAPSSSSPTPTTSVPGRGDRDDGSSGTTTVMLLVGVGAAVLIGAVLAVRIRRRRAT